MRLIAQRAGGGELKKVEDELKKLKSEISILQGSHNELSKEIRKPKSHFIYFFFFTKSFFFFFVVSKKNSSTTQMKEQETKLQKLEGEKNVFVEKIKLLEEKLMKQDAAVS